MVVVRLGTPAGRSPCHNPLVEGSNRRTPLLLVLTWILSFCLTVLAMEWRSLLGPGLVWTLPFLAAASLAALNWWHYGWQYEYQTTSLVWNVIPIAAAIGALSLLGFIVNHKIIGLLIAVQNIVVCIALALLLRREGRRRAELREWERKTDEELATLTPQQLMERIRAEMDELLPALHRQSRRMTVVLILSAALLVFGVVEVLWHR